MRSGSVTVDWLNGAALIVSTLSLSVLVAMLPDSRDALVPALVALAGVVGASARGRLLTRAEDSDSSPTEKKP